LRVDRVLLTERIEVLELTVRALLSAQKLRKLQGGRAKFFATAVEKMYFPSILPAML